MGVAEWGAVMKFDNEKEIIERIEYIKTDEFQELSRNFEKIMEMIHESNQKNEEKIIDFTSPRSNE
jgi:hypothetical protein